MVPALQEEGTQRCFGLGAELEVSWDVSSKWSWGCLGSSIAVNWLGQGSATGLGGCWKSWGSFAQTGAVLLNSFLCMLVFYCSLKPSPFGAWTLLSAGMHGHTGKRLSAGGGQ